MLRRSPHLLARTVSILGHPAILMPTATLLALGNGNSPRLFSSFVAVAAIAIAFTLWSVVQVQHGKWRHVDASHPRERRDLNRGVFVVLATGALVAAAARATVLSIGLGCGTLIIGLAISFAGKLKLSQHVAFATMAIFIVGYVEASAVAMTLVAVAIAWSRLALGRHTGSEVIAGGGAGILAGIVLRSSLVAIA